MFSCSLRANFDIFARKSKETNNFINYSKSPFKQCLDDATRSFYHECIGEVCGGNIPDGTCDNRCTPIFEEEAAVCEEMYENGEIELIELKWCMEKPGGPVDNWENCFMDCTCEMPWCNCVPPEERPDAPFTTHKFGLLRDFEMVCYHDE